MKKRITAFLLALFVVTVFLFGACGKTGTYDADSIAPADSSSDQADDLSADPEQPLDDADMIRAIYSDGKTTPTLTLTADKTEVAPGDTFTVSWNVADAENLACFQFRADFDTSVFTVEKEKRPSLDNFVSYSNAKEGQILFTGVSTTTVDIVDSTTVFSAVFKVNDNAAAGTYQIESIVKQFMIGTDDAGDTIADLISVKSLDSALSVTVK